MVDKITTAPTDNTVVEKINEVIDALGTATGANTDLSNLSATGEAHFQTPLVSGTNIKTINNTSLLGSGNISVLQNNANGVTGSIAIDDITGGTYYNYSTAYGSLAIAKEYSVAIGNSTQPQGTYCVAIGVNANSLSYGAAIGRISYASNYAVAIGSEAAANANYSTAIGYASGVAAGSNSSIQIGYGTNLTANTFNVGFYNNSNTHYNWQLLDGTTGLIPDARISTNIARSTDIPTTDQTFDGTSANAQSGVAIAGELANYSNTNLSNITNTGKIAIAHNAMPTTSEVVVSSIASGGTYIAPHDGYLIATGKQVVAGGGFVQLSGNAVSSSWIGSGMTGNYTFTTIPVKKGLTVTVYWYGFTSGVSLNFAPCIGSENEV